MALRIEKAFGVSMDTLMRMQNSYDIAQARSREGEINVKRYFPNAKDFGRAETGLNTEVLAEGPPEVAQRRAPGSGKTATRCTLTLPVIDDITIRPTGIKRKSP